MVLRTPPEPQPGPRTPLQTPKHWPGGLNNTPQAPVGEPAVRIARCRGPRCADAHRPGGAFDLKALESGQAHLSLTASTSASERRRPDSNRG